MNTDLESRIVEVLKASDRPLLAKEIAALLRRTGDQAVTRHLVNQTLCFKLSGRVRKDEKYRWSLATEEGSEKRAKGKATGNEPSGHEIDLTKAYQMLGVIIGAAIEEVKSAYKRKINEWHPDKVSTMAKELQDLATRETARINVAYDLILRSIREQSRRK